MIIGQRTYGKTFFWARKCLEHYLDTGLPYAYVRRKDRILNIGLFDPHIDWIKERTNGEYNSIEYRTHCWYLIRIDQNMQIVKRDPNPFCILHCTE